MLTRPLDQVAAIDEVTELIQGELLELADALLADPQLLADLHEGLRVAAESEATENDHVLPAGEVAKHFWIMYRDCSWSIASARPL